MLISIPQAAQGTVGAFDMESLSFLLAPPHPAQSGAHALSPAACSIRPDRHSGFLVALAHRRAPPARQMKLLAASILRQSAWCPPTRNTPNRKPAKNGL